MAKGNKYSFLHVNKPEIDLPASTDPYSDQVYLQGKLNLDAFITKGWLYRDTLSRFYVYAQEMGGRVQYGLMGAASIEDYEGDKIKKHEKTLEKKELDRTRLTDT